MQDRNPTIAIIVDDMFFASKIRAAAEAAGRTVRSIKSREQLDSELNGSATILVIVDLNSSRLDPFEAIQSIKSITDLASVPVVSFVSHVQTNLIRRAQEAGCDYVLPRSVFSQMLPEIVAGRFDKLNTRATS